MFQHRRGSPILQYRAHAFKLMANDSFSFTEDAVRRIIRSVLASERQTITRPQHRQHGYQDVPIYKGKLAGTLSYQGSATVTLWVRSSGAEAAISETVTAYDWMLSSGETLASGCSVVVAFISGEWYVIASSCCAT